MRNKISPYSTTAYRLLWHLLFWAIFVAVHTLYYGNIDHDYADELAQALRYLPFKMMVTYFTLYITIPRFLLEKKYVRTFLVFVISVLTASLIQHAVDYFILIPIFNPNWTETHYLFYPAKIFRTFLGMYPVVIIGACIKLANHLFEKDRQAQELERQKLKTELNFLKTQIHPHFLFNTLNNLYALTLKKSEDAPEVVMKLSKLLSFMLYDADTDTISIQKELELIAYYTDLESIRYDNRLNFTFKTHGPFAGKQIPPMLILPFVENAFKHSSKDETGSLSISIDIRVQESKLIALIKNSKPSESGSKTETAQKGGVGLENIQRRLHLLYPDQHTLEIEETKTQFSVTLIIELNPL